MRAAPELVSAKGARSSQAGFSPLAAATISTAALGAVVVVVAVGAAAAQAADRQHQPRSASLRRSVIAGTENRGKVTEIEAHAPLKELFGYSSAMRSLSQGRAGCSIEPLHYAPAPAEVMREYEI